MKFKSVNDLAHSEELVKRKIYIEASSANAEALDELAQDDMGAYLAGFTLENEEGKEPLLIPFKEEFIISFDPEQRKIQMEIPVGLIVI